VCILKNKWGNVVNHIYIYIFYIKNKFDVIFFLKYPIELRSNHDDECLNRQGSLSRIYGLLFTRVSLKINVECG